jgi:hypothetical protein
MRALYFVVAAALPLPALGMDCFAEGGAAYQAGRYSAARAAFSAMQQVPECQSDPLLLLNMARTAQALVERGDSPELACAAAREYGAFLRTSPDETLASVAQQGQAAMRTRCTTHAADAHRMSNWIWTGAAAGTLVLGGVLNGMARSSAADGEAATDAQRAAVDQAEYDVAKRQADDAYSAASTQALSSYLVLGAGLALGGYAAWRWFGPDGSSVAVMPGPGSLSVQARW